MAGAKPAVQSEINGTSVERPPDEGDVSFVQSNAIGAGESEAPGSVSDSAIVVTTPSSAAAEKYVASLILVAVLFGTLAELLQW